MLTKKSFEYYRLNQVIIDRLKADPCIISDRVRGSRYEPPYDQHGITIQGVNERKLKRNRSEIARLQARVDEVDRALQAMDDPELKMALILKFQDGMTWLDVGKVLRRKGDTLRKRAERYFEDLENRIPQP